MTEKIKVWGNSERPTCKHQRAGSKGSTWHRAAVLMRWASAG
jgi:hypothetical protein